MAPLQSGIGRLTFCILFFIVSQALAAICWDDDVPVVRRELQYCEYGCCPETDSQCCDMPPPTPVYQQDPFIFGTSIGGSFLLIAGSGYMIYRIRKRLNAEQSTTEVGPQVVSTTTSSKDCMGHVNPGYSSGPEIC